MVSIDTVLAVGVVAGVLVRTGLAYYNKTRTEPGLKWDHRYTIALLAALGTGLTTAPEILATFVPPSTESAAVAGLSAFVYAAGLNHVVNWFFEIGK